MTNETINNIISRRSVRKFKQIAVEDELLELICKAGTYAPTGMNRQEPTIVLIKNKETIAKLSKLNAKYLWSGHPEHADPFYGAPYIAIVFSNKAVPTYIYDGSLVMGNMMNAAHSLGVGSCWIHRAKEMFEDEEGLQYLKEWDLTQDDIGIGICILGYADGPNPELPPRKKDYIKIVD